MQFVNNDSNHYKFTGKERDSETGLDYFGARYYSNGLGRFISADWSATPVPVPYADFSDPQTFNLYGYVRGLPTTKADLNGHGWWQDVKDDLKDWWETTKDNFREAGIGAKNRAIESVATPIVASYNLSPGVRDAGLQVTLNHAAFAPQNEHQAAGAEGFDQLAATLPIGIEEMVAARTAVIVDMTVAARAPSIIGFSEGESAMIGQSLRNLSGPGYDLAPFRQLIKADMPPGCCAMSLSTPPTGAALGDGAFSSQGMLDHTMEEELLHLHQNLPNQTFARGTAAANEAAVDAARKFPEPQQ